MTTRKPARRSGVIRVAEEGGELFDASWFAMDLAFLRVVRRRPRSGRAPSIASAELVRDQGNDALDLLHMYLEALLELVGANSKPLARSLSRFWSWPSAWQPELRSAPAHAARPP